VEVVGRTHNNLKGIAMSVVTSILVIYLGAGLVLFFINYFKTIGERHFISALGSEPIRFVVPWNRRKQLTIRWGSHGLGAGVMGIVLLPIYTLYRPSWMWIPVDKWEISC
jgi:hypothetical protein